MADAAVRYPILAGKARAMAAVPLLLKGEAIGVLAIGFVDSAHEFTHLERRLLLILADIGALALSRERADSTTSARQPCLPLSAAADRLAGARRPDGLAALERQLRAAATTVQVGVIVADHVPSVLGAQAAFVGVVEDSRRALLVRPGWVGAGPDCTFRCAQRPLGDHAPMTDAARGRHAVYLTGAADRQCHYPDNTSAAIMCAQACAALPLRDRRGRTLGALCVSWPGKVEFDAALRTDLGLIADLCAQTVERTLMHDDDHTIVSALRDRVLRPLPAPPALDAHAVCRPAYGQRMGGDFYAGIRLDDHRLGIVVGDVAGHGTAVAGEMIELHTLLCVLLADGAPLDDLAA